MRRLAFLGCVGAGPAPVLPPKAVPGIKLLHDAGYSVVVVSNQPGLAFGASGESDVETLERALRARLRLAGVPLEGFYWCPHHPRGTVEPFSRVCACRMPEPGLLLRAGRELRADLGRSWLFGDVVGVEAARRVGCRTALLDDGGEREWWPDHGRRPHVRGLDLASAARRVLAA